MKTYSANTKGRIRPYDPYDQSRADEERIDFQFNPTSIQESRGSEYNFSEGQGQVLPLAQYGRIRSTDIRFTLFMFNHNGVRHELTKLRKLTLPRTLSNLAYYSQAQPYTYELYLHDYGAFYGVFSEVNLKTRQYDRDLLSPIHLEADVRFVPITLGFSTDVSVLHNLTYTK
jgi:hypothetical protein